MNEIINSPWKLREVRVLLIDIVRTKIRKND